MRLTMLLLVSGLELAATASGLPSSRLRATHTTLWTTGLAPQTANSRPATDPDSGVPQTLATERARRISEVRYDIALTIPADKAQPITGRELLRFSLKDARAPVVVDFDPDTHGILRSTDANGAPVQVRQVNGHVIVPAGALMEGANVLGFEFSAGDASLNRSDDYLYALFVPARAHLALPCFDQPDLKARWTLALDVPDGWQVLANGAERERTTGDGRLRVRFAETQPFSTYLFTFAAGKFQVEQAQRDGRTFRMFHREPDAAKVARNRGAIFDLHAAALAWLEKYTGVPYPFGKFDFLLVPAFQFGGMEHPGAIYYNANGLMLDESATQDQLLGRASTISHETSHMWFGDLVTMKWFDDVWMKEVFANFMAAKIVNPSFPNVNHDLRFLWEYYPSAYGVDRTAGTNEIRQPLANLDEAGTLYGAIIYQKAPIVMRQLESIVGPNGFRDGLRQYLHDYAFGNATWNDLIGDLSSHTTENLTAWSHAWVEERGRPTIRTDARISNGRIDSLAFVQSDPFPPRHLIWNQRLEVAIGSGGEQKLLPVSVNAARVNVPDAKGLAADYILPNGAGLGYGDFHLDPHSRTWLLAHVTSIKDDLTRGSAYLSIWESMLDGDIKASDVMSLTLRALPEESSELTVQRLLGYARENYWRYMDQPARLTLAPQIESVLRSGLDQAPSSSLKSAWFSALRDVAQTPATLAWLTRVWRQEEKVPGLTLAENDYLRLAEELAVRNVPDTAAILDQEAGRIKNPDRRAQFAFVRPALSNDPAVREKWFASLAQLENRRHEPWVLDGLHYLHHPLRGDASEKYIEPSLIMLRAIQRTGDIFFPKRWLDSTLGSYHSPQAAAIVRGFLSRLPPEYPERLRRIILSSADDLFRASAAH